MLAKEKKTYDLWKEKVKCYELHTTMCQKENKFVEILNGMQIKNLMKT